jgi:hypothetical protein
VSPPTVVSTTAGPPEGANLTDQAPAWTASAGPAPPQTLEHILAAFDERYCKR